VGVWKGIGPVAPGKVPQTNISYSEKFSDGGISKEIDVWVSDHFGLALVFEYIR
jgi:hypothetical protein